MEKQYRAQQNEQKMQAFWEREDIYRFQPEQAGELYAIDTPPPTVSGSLHIGHIFSYTQAEMIARFRRMRGYNVFFPFGFDDNGLPTERLTEKELGIAAHTLSRNAFAQNCQTVAQQYVQQYIPLWKSLGFSADWSEQYTTNGEQSRRIAQRSFIELVQNGKAYYKQAPVLWCTHCQTSIAQAELETQEQRTSFVFLPFGVAAEQLCVATTRPELLYGCVCLFVNPDDPRYSAYIGRTAHVPLFGHAVPILGDELVSIEQGTGVVMCATFGDSTDALWFEKHNLPYRPVVTQDGTLDPSIPFVGGLRLLEARERILQLLETTGLLLQSHELLHAVATHERCGTAAEIIPSGQWYIDLLSNKTKWLAAADSIRWYPAHMKARYLTWVQNLKWDWCISRQRYHGVPIPVWYCESCGKPTFAAIDTLPVVPAEQKLDGVCTCGCKSFRPETAVFDTWATSSLTPLLNAKAGETDDRSATLLPMALRTQAHEIIRTWTFYTIVRSYYHNAQIPWKEIMVSGFVLAKQGEKISKSRNNAKSTPQALITTHSADALRYWAANAKLGTDTYFDEVELVQSKRFLTKFWNAAKFTLSHLQDYAPETGIQDLLPADRWLLACLDETTRKANGLLMEYEIGAARHETDAFFWRDFCDFYIELAKNRLYSLETTEAAARRSAQITLYHAFFRLLQLYAIYVPHITEVVYQEYFRKHQLLPSLHQTHWDLPNQPDEALLQFGDVLCEAITQARKYKTEHQLSHKAPIPFLNVSIPDSYIAWLKQSTPDLKACTGAQEITIQIIK